MQVTKEETGGYEGAGFGRDGKPSFWISAGGRTTPRLHIAFVADDRAAVNAFFEAALAAGAADSGVPGVRAHYHPHYYAAFVLDPEGHNIEAVCHKPA
jgi:catechol 2,3-dioxygenase-like lactoylglutathione lyase family enzyme